ncbi:MarR family transcriptional regulator [Deinococcus sp. KSM4-11]|uniref:MarR family winged helix-turn-helix transcriptional regulator n=1 Tax=Deinococcus sp. KSM4-11 TaxID=2568654 RepID=UPI0010A5503F|nr:MarR family winged helix-turn-helix transcriptional regulator [Deinococcus sp. KSM4-11]THF88419.1 MarR family transcriptional regulator [Deinococcus sp. KSM4-11]
MTRAVSIPKLHPRQREVFSAAYLQPGQSLNELARALRINSAVVAHAVYRLEALGLISTMVRPVVTNTPRRQRRVCRLVSPAAWTVA